MTAIGAAQTVPGKTLFVECSQSTLAKRVLSPVSVTESGGWKAYIEVTVQDHCLHTTRLWAARENRPWRLLLMISPTREEDGNGMQILGWAPNSRMLLAKAQYWQYGTDGGAREEILAVDARTGLVYNPDLEKLREDRKPQQCGYEVVDAGFRSDPNVVILVRLKWFTYVDEGTELTEIPAEKRCTEGDETWSFNYAAGEVKKVDNSQPLILFKKFVANPRTK